MRVLLTTTHLQGHDSSDLGCGVALFGDVGKGLETGCLGRCLRFVSVSVGLVLFMSAACQGHGTDCKGK
jgi:hypothetical protein